MKNPAKPTGIIGESQFTNIEVAMNGVTTTIQNVINDLNNMISDQQKVIDTAKQCAEDRTKTAEQNYQRELRNIAADYDPVVEAAENKISALNEKRSRHEKALAALTGEPAPVETHPAADLFDNTYATKEAAPVSPPAEHKDEVAPKLGDDFVLYRNKAEDYIKSVVCATYEEIEAHLMRLGMPKYSGKALATGLILSQLTRFHSVVNNGNGSYVVRSRFTEGRWKKRGKPILGGSGNYRRGSDPIKENIIDNLIIDEAKNNPTGVTCKEIQNRINKVALQSGYRDVTVNAVQKRVSQMAKINKVQVKYRRIYPVSTD